MNLLSTSKIFAYIFKELSEEEYQQVEQLVLEHDDYAVQVADLMEYCSTHKIFSSAQMQLHLENKKHQFFQQSIEAGKDVPQALKEKYQNSPKEILPTPKEVSEEIPEEKISNNKWWGILSILLLAGIAFTAKECLTEKTPSTEVVNPIEENTSYTSPDETKLPTDKVEQKEEEQQIKEKKEKEEFQNTVPKTNEDPKKLNRTNPQNQNKRQNDKSKKPLADASKENKIYKLHKESYPLQALVTTVNLRGVDQADQAAFIKSLIEKDSLGEKLDNQENLELGKHFLGEQQFDQAIQYFEKVQPNRAPTLYWLMMHTYLYQETPSALQKAKQLFKEEIIANSRRRVKIYVSEMPQDLKDFLLK